MTAKQYLSQYQLARIKIAQRQEQLEEYRTTIGYSGIQLSDKVQTSPKDALSDKVAKAVDLEIEIYSEIKASLKLKHQIIPSTSSRSRRA